MFKIKWLDGNSAEPDNLEPAPTLTPGATGAGLTKAFPLGYALARKASSFTITPVVSILQKGHKVLAQKATIVSQAEIKSSRIKKVIADLIDALEKEDDGVAIAAPQIGIPLRIFVVSKKVFTLHMTDEEREEAEKKGGLKHLVCINPEITKLSREKDWMDEGCLSVRYLYGKVRRSKKVLLRAQNENGEFVTLSGKDLIAQIFQHETDHLNGILFFEKAKDLVDIPPQTPEHHA